MAIYVNRSKSPPICYSTFEHLKLTCSDIAATLFDWVVSRAGDSFAVEVI